MRRRPTHPGRLLLRCRGPRHGVLAPSTHPDCAVTDRIGEPATPMCCNGGVSLSDGDIAALAREVVDRVDPDLDVRIEPADPVDPYRFETAAWVVHAGAASSYIVASLTAEQALDKLAR